MLNGQYVSDCSFLGKRNYIHAHRLLEFAITSLKEYYNIKDNIQISYFNVHHEAIFNVFLAKEKRANLSAVAELKCLLDGTWNILYLYHGDKKIHKRVEDETMPVEIVNCDGGFSGVGTIEHVCSFWDALASIVEINKQLHFISLEKPMRDPEIRAVYFKKFMTYEVVKNNSLSVDFKCVGNRSFQDIDYSMSNVSWCVGDVEYSMEICFSYKK